MLVFYHLGNVGVRTFFVISGFLITTLLLGEAAKTGTVRLRGFYWRRTLRILPANYVLIAVVAALAALGLVQLPRADLLHALTYTQNYTEPQWILDHLWSLSVEEQFYLLWPSLLVLAGLPRAFRGAALVVLSAPLVRLLAWTVLGASATAMTRHFELVADVLATGCLLAVHYNRLGRSALYGRLQASPWFLPVAVGLILAGNAVYLVHPGVFYVIGQSVATLGTAACVDFVVRNPDTWAGRLMNVRPLVFVGTISYSLYLWQEVLINPGASWAISSFPWCWLSATVAALASYYAVERPALQWRIRFDKARAAQATRVSGN